MAYLFTPPFRTGAASTVPRYTSDSTHIQRRLFSHFAQVPSSVSVLNNAGVISEVVNPSQDQIAAASFYYQGGRTHTVTDAEAAVLVAAGYTVTPA